MKPRTWTLLVSLGLLAPPYSALANAGTPLMWAGMLHLVFGNALIGLFEGLLIAWVFSLPKRKTVLVMIGANYFSAWAGGVFLGGKIADFFHRDLNNGWRWFWTMAGVTYFLTLLLEWPFVARLEVADARNPVFVEVLTNLAVEAAQDHRATYTSPPQYEGTWFNFGEASPLGSATNSQWKFRAGFWPVEGLVAENKATAERLHFS